MYGGDAIMTARLYNIATDRPPAELREWSDSDPRVAMVICDYEREVERTEARESRRMLMRKFAQAVLFVGGCWLLAVGVMLWK
jgi:hypothetical protein